MDSKVIELENSFTRHKSAVGSEISTARTKMTANELKVFYQISTLIDKDDSEFIKYTISIKDFVSSFPTFSQTNIKSTQEICRALAKQTFEIENPINGNWEIYTIFSSFKFDNKAQTITISFNDEMRPYLLNLRQFTKIENIEYIKKFDSKYAIRLYALLKDYRKMSYRDMDIEALKKIFHLERKRSGNKKSDEKKPKRGYDDYHNFKSRILLPAIKEINEKSDLFISSVEEIKKQRKKVLKIRINFQNQVQRIAEYRIKFLLDHYEKHKEEFGFKIFKGFKYYQSNQIRTITSIYQERENNYYALYCDNSDLVSFSCHDANTFLNRLCNGIMDAIEIIAEKEKQTRLDLIDWQNEQDKIAFYKEIINSWTR